MILCYDPTLVHVSHGMQCRRFVKISMHEFEDLVQRHAGYEQAYKVFDGRGKQLGIPVSAKKRDPGR